MLWNDIKQLMICNNNKCMKYEKNYYYDDDDAFYGIIDYIT
jgi:hypothetical protein